VLKRVYAAVSAASIVLSAAGAATAQEVHLVHLEYGKNAEVKGIAPYGSAFLRPQAERPAGDWKLPSFAGAEPLFCMAKLGDSEYLIVLDASGGGEHYDRAWLDRNGDGNLSDEPALEGEVAVFEGGFYSVDFEDTIDVEYELDGARLPYCLGLRVSGNDMRELMENLPEGGLEGVVGGRWHVYANLTTGCCYSGRFELDGRDYLVRLADSDCDGRFGEPAAELEGLVYGSDTIYAPGDHVYLTGGEKLTSEDLLLMGDRLMVGQRLFDVAVDVAGAKLTLTPRTEDLLPLALSHAPERLVAHTRGFEHTVMMVAPGDVARLPAGDYRLFSYSMLKTGERGDVWRVAAGGSERSPYVTLDGGGDDRLEFGEPFAAFAELPRWFGDMPRGDDGKEVQLGFHVKGCGQDHVTDLARVSGKESSCAMSTKEPRRPAEPSYFIVAADGERVVQGDFKYG